jgi:hypothetical protein
MQTGKPTKGGANRKETEAHDMRDNATGAGAQADGAAAEGPEPFDDSNLIRRGWKPTQHPYVNRDGVLLYETVRYKRRRDEPKKMWARHNKDGTWYWGAGTDERVLYRLQNLITADPDESCHIAEGEKDADRLASLNLLATTVAFGNWDGVDLEPLRGRAVYVHEDNNDTGRKKAAEAAAAVHRVARSVRIVRLPGLREDKDVSDWLDANDDDVELLIESCRAAPTYKPEPETPPKGEEVVTLAWDCMADVEPAPVDWIWPGYLARGKLTLIAGDPGMGKSQIGLDLAARITRGEHFPDGRDPSKIGSALILTAEDAAADTVRPRLEAVGANLRRVHRLRAAVMVKDGARQGPATFSLQCDLLALAEKVKTEGDVALIVIDPITSYMGMRLDSHLNTAVRAVLEPLATWAEEHHVAVLGITHPPKSAPAKALHAIIGSIAYVAAARIVFLAIEEQETKRRLLLAVKNNLGPLAPGLGYGLGQTIVSKGIVASRVTWDSAPVTVTADEAIAASNKQGDGPAMSEAKDFLIEELAGGRRDVEDIQKAARKAGISWSTIKRAKKALGIESKKRDVDDGWDWVPPRAEETQRRAEGAQ